ncbi:porin family protein [Aquimarina pacifica]|uniref:porin family protein n=1 Tax=Aquimarina pacifica TaxID=1296415 RepID=UPI000470283F|nr:porin family protein [Aquimarina pacifica]
MKKLLLFVVVLSLSFVTTAQEESIRFGAKAGLNLSNFTGDDADDLDMRTSFHIGALVEIPISETFAFQPELLYSSQGAQFEEEGVDFKSIVNYINIPLILKYYVSEGFSLQAGPQIGILASAKAKAEGNGAEVDVDAKDLYKGIDFGLNLGLGYQLEAGIFFDARYNIGLANIIDEDDADAKNSVIQISVGYKF